MAEPSSYPAVLTLAEAAVALSLSPFTVGKMCRDGRLPRIARIRRVRIPSRAVEAMRISLIDETRDQRIAAARASMASCELVPQYHGPRTCFGCGKTLVGLQRRWCSAECIDAYWVNHSWTYARAFAVETAGRDEACCARCGVTVGWTAEVNHIVPRNGAGYGRGCHHHQSNLEVLCRTCHAIETTRQLQERRVRQALTRAAS